MKTKAKNSTVYLYAVAVNENQQKEASLIGLWCTSLSFSLSLSHLVLYAEGVKVCCPSVQVKAEPK